MRGSCVSLPSSLIFSTAWPMAGTNTSRYSRLWLKNTNKDPLGEQCQVNNNYKKLHYEIFPHCHYYTCRWVWAEGGQNFAFEQSLDVGGFGYPVRQNSFISDEHELILIFFFVFV